MTTQFYKLPTQIAARSDVPPAAKVVFAVILDAGHGNQSVIGIRRIMSRTGLASDTVQRCVRSLVASGLLAVERGRSGQRQKYVFLTSEKPHQTNLKTVRKTGTVQKGQPCGELVRSKKTNRTRNPHTIRKT